MIKFFEKIRFRWNVHNIYTPLEEAREEILRRWNDEALKKKVEEFLGSDLPEPIIKEPKFLITRQITSPNEEFFIFLKMAESMGLKTLGWEYLDDVFVTTNRDKACLGRIGIIKRFDKHRLPVIHYNKIIDLTGNEENKKFKNINTICGGGLVDYHHKLLKDSFPEFELIDASNWYKSNGMNAKDYYTNYLSIFLRNGVLFEDFFIYGHEEPFTRNVVLPAFKKIVEEFGIKPLVVKPILGKNITELMLPCYRESIFKKEI